MNLLESLKRFSNVFRKGRNMKIIGWELLSLSYIIKSLSEAFLQVPIDVHNTTLPFSMQWTNCHMSSSNRHTFLHCSYENILIYLNLCHELCRLRLFGTETILIKISNRSLVYFKTRNAETLHRFFFYDRLIIIFFNAKTLHLQKDLKM